MFPLTATSIMQWLAPQSASVQSLLEQNQLSQNSEVFIAYLVVSLLIKRSSFLAAFFMSCMLFEMSLFDQLTESQLYAITFSIYSYVIFCKGLTFLTKAACVIILVLCVTLGYDAYFYGIGGAYGASETFVYNNIEHLALYAHIILISTLIPYRRITNSLRRFIAYVMYLPRYSVNFVVL